MIRIWTYVNLDAFGNPANAGTYFDPRVYDLNAPMSENTQIQSVRDGTERIIDDPQYNYPTRLRLSLLVSEIDLISETLYHGSARILGPVLYLHKSAKIPIVIFHRSSMNTSPKTYLCRLMEIDPLLAGCATVDTTDQTFKPAAEPGTIMMHMGLYVDRDGIFTNYDNVGSGTYHAREPAS